MGAVLWPRSEPAGAQPAPLVAPSPTRAALGPESADPLAAGWAGNAGLALP